MTRTRSLLVLIAVVLATAGCSDADTDPDASGSGAEASAASGSGGSGGVDDAVDLLHEATPPGFRARPVASGTGGSTDAGQHISEQALTGPHAFLIACSGQGEMSVTVAKTYRHVACGDKATVIPVDGGFEALVVGQVQNRGAYAWEVLAKP